MTSTSESSARSPRSAVRRAAVILHGKRETVAPALERLRSLAVQAGVELVLEEDEREDVDLAVVLGGDGTMLRALHRYLGRDVPVVGVNFGRVGFLSSIQPAELDAGIERVFSGDYRVVALPTLGVDVGGRRAVALNDVVVTSSTLGRMVHLGWAIGGEDLGSQPCDGVICSTPSGSTAYNLSNGGPVLVRGLDAMAVTFIAPHSLHARPVVVPRGVPVTVENETEDVSVTVLVDGHRLAEAEPGRRIAIDLDAKQGLLATLPESTFFRRYREVFAG